MYLFSRRYSNDAGKGTLSVSLAEIMLLVMAVSASCAETLLSGRVTKVIDGDSFVLKTTKRSYEIRLWGIDCPEYTQPHSANAKSVSRKLLETKKVRVAVK